MGKVFNQDVVTVDAHDSGAARHLDIKHRIRQSFDVHEITSAQNTTHIRTARTQTTRVVDIHKCRW